MNLAPTTDELVDQLHTQIDKKTRVTFIRANVQSKGTLVPVCAKGCAACCSYVVSAAPAECYRLAKTVEAMPEPQRTDTIRLLYSWSREFYEFTQTQPKLTSREIEQRMAARWGIKRIGCPFLNTETHACNVYANRPAMCRTYHACMPPPDLEANEKGQVVRPPPEGCFTEQEDVDVNMPPAVWQIEPLLGLQATGAMMQFFWRYPGMTPPMDGTYHSMPTWVYRWGKQRFHWRMSEKDRVPLYVMTQGKK